METAPHDVAAPGTAVLGRYVLVEEIGSGGFGTVWLARDQRLERPVAIKRIPVRTGLGGSVSERAEREGLAAARLSHPAVVQLYEAGRDADAVYLVSELVRGSTLSALLAEGALSDRDVILIGMAMCDALAHAHARGVIHRDVKPGNVLVCEAASDGVVAKLTDFGIARISGDDALTATGDVVGTLAYMAPEQAEGRGATAASDLYALGLVLYEALGGVNPIRQGNAAATARRVGMRLPALRRLRRDLPRGLCAAIDATVLADPALRGSTDSLRLALAQALPQVTDDPGTVEAPAWAVGAVPETDFPARERRRERDVPTEAWDEPPGEAVRHDEDLRPAHRARWLLPVSIPARLVHAALSAGLIALVLTLVDAKLPLQPAALAAIGGAVIALLPRLGYIVAAGTLTIVLYSQDDDVWQFVALAAAPMPLLLIHRPQWWSSPPLAAALGYVSAATAWPAIAGQARGPYTRAVLGAAGFWSLQLISAILGENLLLAPHTSIEGIVQAQSIVIAAVWAAAALVLPYVVRGHNIGADLLGAVAWAGVLAVGTQYASGGEAIGGLAGAAALAAVVATLAQALKRR